MPFSRPSLATLAERVLADVVAFTDVVTTPLRRATERVLALVLAGLAHGLYGFIQSIAKDTPPREGSSFEGLLAWANFLLATPHIKAASATGIANFTGTDTTAIPSGTEITNENGKAYTTDTGAVIAAGVAAVAITAVEGGADGNVDAGTAFTLSSPIPGIDSNGTFVASDGSDDETKAALFARMRARLTNPPRGGGPGDYVDWALEASASVDQAYEYPKVPELGDVTVVITTDDLGIPSAPLIATVQAYIDSVRPTHMNSAPVIAPVAEVLAITITGGPVDAPTQALVETAMQDYIIANQTPGGTILIAELENAAQSVPGQSGLSITIPGTDTAPASQFGVFNSLSVTFA